MTSSHDGGGPGLPNTRHPGDVVLGMTHYDFVHNWLKATTDTHHEGTELVQDVPLPLDLGEDWLAELARRVLEHVHSASTDVPVARALANIAYDVTRELHRYLCGDPGVPACRADTKTASDFIRVLTYVLLGCQVCASLHAEAGPYLEADVKRQQTVAAVESVFGTLLCAPDDRRDPMSDIGAQPIIQINTPISNVPEPDYIAKRTLAMQLKAAIEESGFRVEVTSDYATPSNRGAFVDEGQVRARIYRASAIIIFSQGAGDGSSAAWTLAGELNVPTLVLRPPDDLHTAARFPGQMDAREHKTYVEPDDAVRLVGEFFGKHRGRIHTRAAYIRGLAELDTDHLVQRMTSLDADAFDASMVTWERARHFTSSPVMWFQAHPSTRTEICRVLGLTTTAGLHTPPAGSTANGAPADQTSTSGTRPDDDPANVDTSRSSNLGDPAVAHGQPTPPATGDRTRISLRSLSKLLMAAESLGVGVEGLHPALSEWQRPDVPADVSLRAPEPGYEDWRELLERTLGR